jgi:hypothetical protein
MFPDKPAIHAEIWNYLTFALLMPQKISFKIPEPALYELQSRK